MKMSIEIANSISTEERCFDGKRDRTNVYPIGEIAEQYRVKYEDYSFRKCGDIVFQKSTSKNMDILWKHFYKHESYPAYYMGKANKTAICKCPISGKEEWFNGERNLSVENPEKGSTVTVILKIKDKTYVRDFVFMGWVVQPVHEWSMTKGTTLQLEQSFIDGLSNIDRRYLKMKC